MSLVSTYRLCKGCQAFLTHSFGPLVSQNRCWVGRGGMYKSTPPKCLICLRMWNKTVEAGWGDLRSIAEYPLEVNYWLKYDDNSLPNGFGLEWILYIDIVMKLRKLETLNFSIWLLESTGSRYSLLSTADSSSRSLFRTIRPPPSHTELQPETSSQQSLDLALGWLTFCRKHHISCNWLSEKNRLSPKRLLDIGQEGELQWKLCIAVEDKFNAPEYMTLSHRWNSSKKILLTAASLDDFRQGMPISELPKTFRDTITVARHLSIRYIWIDSLCIMQDSATDWAEESCNMRRVYANSVCNVAAADSYEDRDEGIFRTRDPLSVSVLKIETQWTGFPVTQFIASNDTEFCDNLLGAPLYKRGWVLQERLLAPRTLHFGKHQIVWICQEHMASETLPMGDYIPDDHLSLTPLRDITEPNNPDGAAAKCAMSMDVFEMWIKIVTEYTSCRLTYSTDRLIALSGIVQVFQARTGDRYFAGIWHSRFCQSLCWHALHQDGRKTARVASEDYNAPSWSWASIDSPIRYDFLTGELLATLKDIHIANNDDLANDASYITIEAPLAPATLVKEGSGFTFNSSEEIGICMSTLKGKARLPRAGCPWIEADLWPDMGTTKVFQDGMAVHCLTLMSSLQNSRVTASGLLLEKILGSDDTYRRIGYFHFNDFDGFCSAMGIIANAESATAMLASTAKRSMCRII